MDQGSAGTEWAKARVQKRPPPPACAASHEAPRGLVFFGPPPFVTPLETPVCCPRHAGATKPEQSAPGTIRGDLCIEVGRNVIHGSDTVENAQKEIALWFPEVGRGVNAGCVNAGGGPCGQHAGRAGACRRIQTRHGCAGGAG
eukprot:352542-Chlamydomonas_euryale.AAC.5